MSDLIEQLKLWSAALTGAGRSASSAYVTDEGLRKADLLNRAIAALQREQEPAAIDIPFCRAHCVAFCDVCFPPAPAESANDKADAVVSIATLFNISNALGRIPLDLDQRVTEPVRTAKGIIEEIFAERNRT